MCIRDSRTLASNLVEMASGILDRYQKQEQAGALTREQAQKLAIETLRSMRQQELYFVVLDKVLQDIPVFRCV